MASYSIILEDVDLGQVIDALESRAQSWHSTAEYMKAGTVSGEQNFVVEECSGELEAERIAKHYRKILLNIYGQLLTQRTRKLILTRTTGTQELNPADR